MKRHRWSLAVSAAVVLIVVAASAFASPHSPERQLAERATFGRVGTPIPARATPFAAISTSWGERATVWVVPTTGGGRCELLQIDDASAPVAYRGTGGGACGTGVQAEPMSVHLSWSRLEDGSYGVLANGRARPGLGAVRFTLEADGDPIPAASKGEHWVAELAPTAASGTLAGSYVVVAYDSTGDEVARLDLNGVVEAATPPS